MVRADGSGFMAAMLPTGMRAVSDRIRGETGGRRIHSAKATPRQTVILPGARETRNRESPMPTTNSCGLGNHPDQ